MISRIEIGAMHLIGKLTLVRLKLPFQILLPIFFISSDPADLNLV